MRRTAALLIVSLIIARLAAQGFGESRLPLLVIEASAEDITDEPKIETRMRLVYGGEGVMNRVDGPTIEYVGRVAIERRGSTSQDLFPKVGYALELRASDGADTAATLLGMPREEDWVLHGPYSDKTLIRNAFTYTMARGLSGYAPRSRFVEVFLGGEYWGIYLLVESIKRDRNRVAVAELEAGDESGDALTGGYILKVDKTTGEDFSAPPFFRLPGRNLRGQAQTMLLYHYPKPGDITAAQRQYISSWMTEFERRLASPQFEDPEAGYAPLVNLESFIDFLFINEVTRNVDGYRLSTYLYKDRDSKGGRLHMGPVWDFNLAIANADYCQGSDVEGWAFDFDEYCGNDGFQPPFWYSRLWSSYAFRQAAAQRWTSLRAAGGPLSDQRLYTIFDSLYADVLGAPAARNFERWPVLGVYTWPNSYIPPTHQAAYNRARFFLKERLAWIDRQFFRLTPVAEAEPTAAGLRLYPNPGRGDHLRVAGINPDESVSIVTWYDASGRLLYTTKDVGAALAGTPQAPGTYRYRIVTSSGRTAEGWWISLGF